MVPQGLEFTQNHVSELELTVAPWAILPAKSACPAVANGTTPVAFAIGTLISLL